MPDNILELPVLTAPRLPRFRGRRYRIGPLAPRADRSVPSVGAGIRTGALTGLFIVAVLAVPFFLVLGASAPAPRAVAAAPVIEGAKVWTDSDVAPPAARIAEARVADPVASPAGPGEGASRVPLGVELIPVLDDESGDLSVGAVAPAEAAPPRPVRPLPAAPRAARP